jgi:hypothetical protein
MSDGYNTSNNNAGPQSGPTFTWNGNTGGWNTITIPTGNSNYIPGQYYTIVVGGGGGGGAAVAAPASEEVTPVEKEKDSGGCLCKKCKEFYDFAEPNQEDGTLICWSCRHGY